MGTTSQNVLRRYRVVLIQLAMRDEENSVVCITVIHFYSSGTIAP